MTRREFTRAALLALGAPSLAHAADEQPLPLPTVRWGGHAISRLLLGHNPLKGMAHQPGGPLGREMKEYFAEDRARGVALMRRCEEQGITTFQMGFRDNERLVEQCLRDRKAEGGRFQWIASFYSLPQEREAAQKELQGLLRMDPPPIGVQQVGNTSDLLMRQGKLDASLDNLKRFRDAGLLVGLGSHNHEVIDAAAGKGWDVDFYQCSFYRSLFGLKTQGAGEVFEAADRDAMTRLIRQLPKPCIAFKVLAAGRHCQSAETVEAALRYAYANIKPTDVVLLGMWQKHQDQPAENARRARKILA